MKPRTRWGLMRDGLSEARYRSFGWRWLKALLLAREGGWLRWKTYTVPEVEIVCEYGGPTYDVEKMPPLRRAWECVWHGRYYSRWTEPWSTYADEEVKDRTRVPQRYTRYGVEARERSKRDMARWDAERAVIEGALMAGGTIKRDGFNNYLMPKWAKLGPGGYRKIEAA